MAASLPPALIPGQPKGPRPMPEDPALVLRLRLLMAWVGVVVSAYLALLGFRVGCAVGGWVFVVLTAVCVGELLVVRMRRRALAVR